MSRNAFGARASWSTVRRPTLGRVHGQEPPSSGGRSTGLRTGVSKHVLIYYLGRSSPGSKNFGLRISDCGFRNPHSTIRNGLRAKPALDYYVRKSLRGATNPAATRRHLAVECAPLWCDRPGCTGKPSSVQARRPHHNLSLVIGNLPFLVPTLCVGMQTQTLRVVRFATQSVASGVPTRSVGTRSFFSLPRPFWVAGVGPR